MNYKEFKKYVDEMNKGIADKLKDSEEELTFYIELVKRFNDICEENEELKKKLTQYHLDIDKLYKIDNPFDKLKYKNTKYMIEENEKLKKQLNELQKPQIFIDTQDMEERYGEELYQDYLEEEVKELKKQQQFFIDYLEDNWKQTQDIWYVKILQKYKEIIGVKDE